MVVAADPQRYTSSIIKVTAVTSFIGLQGRAEGWALPELCPDSGWTLAELTSLCAFKETVGNVWLRCAGVLALGCGLALGSGWAPALSFGVGLYALAAARSSVEAKPRNLLNKKKL